MLKTLMWGGVRRWGGGVKDDGNVNVLYSNKSNSARLRQVI